MFYEKLLYNVVMEKKNIEKFRRKFYNNDDSGKVFLFTILFQILVSLVLSLLVNQIASNYEVETTVITSNIWYILANAFISILVYFLIYFLYTTSKNIDLKAVKIKFKMKWHTYLIAVAIGIISILGVQYLIGALDQLWAIMGYNLSSSPINPTDFGSFVLATFVLALVPAIFEELIFRGIIFNGLNKRFKTIHAMLLSSLLFALYHANLQQLVYPFILGMIMSWLVARTGSIFSSMIVHFINNFIVVLSAYLYNTTGFSMNLPSQWWSYLVAVILPLVAGFIFFLIDKFYFKHKDKEQIEKENKTSLFLYIALAVGGVVFLIFTLFGFFIK